MPGLEVLSACLGAAVGLGAAVARARHTAGPGLWSVVGDLVRCRAQTRSVRLHNEARRDAVAGLPAGAVLWDRSPSGAETMLVMPRSPDIELLVGNQGPQTISGGRQVDHQREDPGA